MIHAAIATIIGIVVLAMIISLIWSLKFLVVYSAKMINKRHVTESEIYNWLNYACLVILFMMICDLIGNLSLREMRHYIGK